MFRNLQRPRRPRPVQTLNPLVRAPNDSTEMSKPLLISRSEIRRIPSKGGLSLPEKVTGFDYQFELMRKKRKNQQPPGRRSRSEAPDQRVLSENLPVAFHEVGQASPRRLKNGKPRKPLVSQIIASLRRGWEGGSSVGEASQSRHEPHHHMAFIHLPCRGTTLPTTSGWRGRRADVSWGLPWCGSPRISQSGYCAGSGWI